ncbi:hypothetical protein EV702DRAFT_1042441 [Suillus placidus]|uniref:Uncharacterized protein n=1 Tax=Suillus placidus TaxID=48579 RepID=A0A9P7A2N3_9AGAM|nr:hypothetical protein EV702DRAFT_1042441 [Suillus placidus]
MSCNSSSMVWNHGHVRHWMKYYKDLLNILVMNATLIIFFSCLKKLEVPLLNAMLSSPNHKFDKSVEERLEIIAGGLSHHNKIIVCQIRHSMEIMEKADRHVWQGALQTLGLATQTKFTLEL